MPLPSLPSLLDTCTLAGPQPVQPLSLCSPLVLHLLLHCLQAGAAGSAISAHTQPHNRVHRCWCDCGEVSV